MGFFRFTESIYRRGARRWRKLYYASGHAFQAKRFNRVRYQQVHLLSLSLNQSECSLCTDPLNVIFFSFFLICLFFFCPPEQRAHCAICADRIWGLGRQGYKCINCKLLVHKKCHKLVTVECGRPMIHVRTQRCFLLMALHTCGIIFWGY